MDRTGRRVSGGTGRTSPRLSVVNISTRADTGGDGIRTKWAFDRLTDWSYRSTRRKELFGYPGDLPYDQRGHWLAKANVIHQRQMFVTDGPAVIQHHGTYFRQHHARLMAEQRSRGHIGLAATLDLWLMYPDELEWLPAPYNLDWLASFRKRSDVLTIAHAPTNRAIKGTDAFLDAMDRLERRLPVRRLVIERKPWLECLSLKGTADIYFDQLALGYGNNAIEAWGMGIPVVAGGAPETLAEMQRRFPLPFYQATEDTLYYVLLDLVSSQVKRDYWGRLGLEHVRRWHADEVVVPALQDIYRRALCR